VIEKVLKMMNAPTNREIPAKASRAVFRKPRSSPDPLGLARRPPGARVDVERALGTAARTARAISPGDRARARPAALSSSKRPSLPVHPLGLGQGELGHRGAAERVHAGDLVSPTTV
jgi:hypothetical protein